MTHQCLFTYWRSWSICRCYLLGVVNELIQGGFMGEFVVNRIAYGDGVLRGEVSIDGLWAHRLKLVYLTIAYIEHTPLLLWRGMNTVANYNNY